MDTYRGSEVYAPDTYALQDCDAYFQDTYVDYVVVWRRTTKLPATEKKIMSSNPRILKQTLIATLTKVSIRELDHYFDVKLLMLS